MPKVVSLEEHGSPENFIIRQQDLAAPGPGEIQLRHTAIGLNFIDIYKRTGLYPLSLPAILGSEAAGVVEAVGDTIDGIKPGDRVAYIGAGGAYAERANIPAAMAARIPAEVDDDAAAAIFLKGLTVEMLVRQVFQLKPGHRCLVWAAAGGVGTLLCQWAHHIGAEIIAVVGSQDKVETAKEAGADHVIDRSIEGSITEQVRSVTGGQGVNVVYDSVGQATFETSLDCLSPLGHMVTYGNASGPVPPVAPLALSSRGSLTLTRPTLFHYATPDRLPQMAASLFELVAKGAIKPKIGHQYALDDVGDAHRLLESGKSIGAIIIKP